MSFNRANYERLVEMARVLVKTDSGDTVDGIAQELYDMAVGVIGQQSAPLFYEVDDLGYRK